MSSNKEQDFKEYLRAKRGKIGTGFTGAPVWVMQKAGKRIWNKIYTRHWRKTSFGSDYNKK